MSDADFDIIVVGSGCAGAVAAYVAASAGKSVLVVERGNYAGAKNMTGGRIYSHSLKEVFPDFEGEAPLERKITHERIAMLSSDSETTVDFTSPVLAEEGKDSYSVLRGPFDQWLAEKAEEAGAEFHFATTAEYIIMQDGAVAGLVASDADGYIKINCKAVVCACGGMGGNPEMMAYFMPDMAQALTGEDALTSMSANDGRGVQMAYWAGAHLETTPVAGMNMKGLSVPGKMNCLPQAVWIDENGRRFANEYYPTSEQRGYQTVFMSRKTKYAVVDNNFTEYRQYTLPQHAGFTANEENIASLRDSLDKAYAKFKGTYEEPEQEEGQGGPGGGGPMTQVEWIADDTLEGLAGQMGLSGDAATEFVAQIERWNGYCEAGVDEEFGRAAEVLFPVKDGPFYACTFDPVLGETMVTMGGIITDGEQNALDANYEPIPGLYMAGNDCGRRFGTEYVTPIPGCSLAFALVLGRECGKSVAKFLG